VGAREASAVDHRYQGTVLAFLKPCRTALHAFEITCNTRSASSEWLLPTTTKNGDLNIDPCGTASTRLRLEEASRTSKTQNLGFKKQQQISMEMNGDCDSQQFQIPRFKAATICVRNFTPVRGLRPQTSNLETRLWNCVHMPGAPLMTRNTDCRKLSPI
jgi:hypothetical protein